MDNVYAVLFGTYQQWLAEHSNALYVTPKDDLTEKYNWLKSSARDKQMGVLSATNRRTLILAPATYTLTETLILDTDFVDVMGIAVSPALTTITKNSDTTVKQTAGDIHLASFSIATTSNGSYHKGFEQAAVNSSASIYENMYFLAKSTTSVLSVPVYGTENLDGFWRDCHATGFAWRMADNKLINGVFLNCTSWFEKIGNFSLTNGYGQQSFGGDNVGVDCSGIFFRCITGMGGFGGCSTWGCNCSGFFYECMAGYRSFALQRQFTGTAIRCISGLGSFGAGSSSGGVNAKFGGKCYDCIVSGGGSSGLEGFPCLETYKSFGMGGGSSEGIVGNAEIINCRYGYAAEYARGETRASSNVVVTEGGVSAHTTTFAAGINANITLTSNGIGSDQNLINFKITLGVGPLKNTWSASYTAASKFIGVTYGVDVPAKTGNDLKTLLDSKSEITAVVTVTLPGNGTAEIDRSYFTKYLSGGTDQPRLMGNHSNVPRNSTVSSDVYVFDNGQTHTNKATGNGIVYSLPNAAPGLNYTFIVMSAQNLDVDPKSNEQIYDEGTGKGNGNYARSSTVGSVLTLSCIIKGRWDVVHKFGTWAYEA